MSPAALEAIRSEVPSVADVEREFPSLCLALAIGVGKTRLMGAFISYLHLAHGIDNFFVLAPNLTIYNKLIADFTPNTPKYVFRGIAEFATDVPVIITGDNYDQRDPASGALFGGVRVNIFNISKINSEVRGGKSPRTRLSSRAVGSVFPSNRMDQPKMSRKEAPVSAYRFASTRACVKGVTAVNS